VGRPWCPRAPAFVVDLFARHWLKTDSSLILQGQRVVPARLLAAGFEFKHARLSGGLGGSGQVGP